MQNNSLDVALEFTPNPNTLKYTVNRDIIRASAYNFIDAEDAKKRSPLASKLFEVPGLVGVMIGKTFITVTKSESGDWEEVHNQSSAIIRAHLASELPVVTQGEEDSSTSHKGGQSEAENKIREILDTEIRPAVAMDGGDITFERFENGVVYLYLQGSCSGCPSSTATLKVGIETRLKEAVPEVQEVVSV